MSAVVPAMVDGLIWCSGGSASVELAVTDSVVTGCPDSVRRWALHRGADEVWRRADRHGLELTWIPDGA